MVDFQHGIVQRHSLDPLADLVSVHGPEPVQILVVHPDREDEMTEFPFRDTPVHAVPDLQGLVHHFLPILPGIDQAVGHGHATIEEIDVSVP